MRNQTINLDDARQRMRKGGEPPMSTLEQRVSHLEKDTAEIKHDLKTFKSETTEDFKYVKKDIAEIKTDVAVIKNKLDNMESNITTNVATKADFLELKVTTKSDIQELKVATKSDIQELKVEMHSLARQTIMWNIGSIFAAVGVVFAILRYTA